jgi:hypothetical protein
MLEGGVRQFIERDNTDAGRHILLRSPLSCGPFSTERAALQTGDIARRLMRGGELHQEKGAGELTVGIMTGNRPPENDANLL